MDRDPELDVTLSDGRHVAIFQIAAVGGVRDVWAIVEPRRGGGSDVAILARRHALYEHARSRKPERWPRHTRNWTPLGTGATDF